MEEKLRIVLTVSSRDEVSGTSTFSDGTKAYWTEGRSSSVKFRYASEAGPGSTVVEWISNALQEEAAGIHMNLLGGDEYGACREMTPAEENEHYYERNTEG